MLDRNGNDRWGALWSIATGEPEGDAIITLTDSPDEVILTFPDGSSACLRWNERYGWEFPEHANPCPGDIAARDRF